MTQSPNAETVGPRGPAASHQASRDQGTEQTELAELRARLREAEETIAAIRGGDVDSLVLGPAGQQQVYALVSADRPYRLIVEAMNEGAATVSPRGVIIYANPRLASMTGKAVAELVGNPVLELIVGAGHPEFDRLLAVGVGDSARGEVELAGPDGTTVPVLLAVSGFDFDGMLLRCLVLTDLTAQRAAENKANEANEVLRQQNAFLERAQQSVGLGWWSSGPDRDSDLTWSPAIHQIFGVTREEFDGKVETFFRLLHPDDASRVVDTIDAALAGRVPYQFEHRVVRPDGSVRWVLQSAVVERDERGAPRRLLGICLDITDRKRTEEENREAAAYNRSLIEASLDPLVTIGPDGTLTDVNAAAEHATGRGRPELLGTEFSDYFTDPGLAHAGYERAFRDGSVRDYPLVLRHRDGHTTPVMYNASVYRDASGGVRGLFAAARDVTQIRRAQEALIDSEGRLRTLFEHAPVGMDDVGPHGEFTRVNARFCQICGYTPGELLSMRIQDLVHSDDRATVLADLRRLRSGEIESYSLEERLLRKGGEIVWVEANRAAVRDADGNLRLLVGSVRDTTAQHRAEAEVRALTADLEARVERRTAELERANENLQAFTYSVSHDLRSPLRALSGFSQALVEEYADRLGETGRGYAARIQAATERMATLIDDLLHLSRVSQAAMNLEPVDLSAEVAAIAAELRTREPGRKVRFTIQDGVVVSADRALIRTVVQNLVENAWKFTGRQDQATIEFGTATGDDGGTCYYVRDNGAGFDPAYAGKLFQPFQRLHATSDFPGTGIGLASVARIVERHGGRAWASGAVGEGATFYFTLDADHAQ